MSLSLIALPIAFAVLKVASVAALGYLLGKRGILHDSATADIAGLVIKIIVPCLVFVNAAGGSIGISGPLAAAVIAAGPAVIGAGYVVSAALSKVARIDPEYRTAVMATSTFQNSAYLPLAITSAVAPLTVAVIGGRGMPATTSIADAIVCISLFGIVYSPLFWGVGFAWLTGGNRAGLSAREFAARLMPPPVVGLLIGYAVALTPLHRLLIPTGAPLRFLFAAAGDIGAMTVPLANLILGAMLAQAGSGSREPARNHAVVIATRFLIVSAIFLGTMLLTRHWWIGSPFSIVAAFVIFLESVTPPATNLAVMAKVSKGNTPRRTAEAIPRILLLAYPLAIVLMPAWLLIFLHLMQKR